MMKLSDRIRENRVRCGLSQEQLAEKMEVSRQAVTKWESGQSAPSTEKLFKLAEVFGTTVDLLLPAEQPQKKGRFDSAGALKMIAAFLALFLIARICCTEREIHSFRYWLFHYDVQMFSYLYGWLLHNGLWWYAMAICVIAAYFGKKTFSHTAFLGFAAGFVLGEWLGPFPAGDPWGQGHSGWLIWGCVFVYSMLLGALFQRSRGREGVSSGKRCFLWPTLWLAGSIVITALILCSRTVPTGH